MDRVDNGRASITRACVKPMKSGLLAFRYLRKMLQRRGRITGQCRVEGIGSTGKPLAWVATVPLVNI